LPETPPQKSLREGVSAPEVWAWASLDFANSGYTTVVLTAVFNAYFVSVVMANNPQATLVWTLILSVSYGLVMLSAPLLGAYADAFAAKRRVLRWATAVCSAGTVGLAFCGPGDLWLTACLLALTNVAYASHQDVSAGFLSEIASPGGLGRLSGFGWAWGYVGGLLTLVLSLIWIGMAPDLLAGEAGAQPLMAGALFMTAGVFAAVGFPALWILQERSEPTGIAWHLAWHRLFRGWRGLAHDPFARPLRRLLLCISVYQAGVAAVITLAAIYAQQVMGFDMRQTILLVLVVNVTASLGAAGFGFLQDRLGHRRSLAVSLLLWVGMVIVAARSETVEAFWLAANLAGLAMGSSQSGARAAVAALAPRGAESEAFGYWGVAVHLASVLGPLAYGVTTALSDNDHRLAILMTGLFFLVGLVLLMRVPFDLRAAQPLEAGPR